MIHKLQNPHAKSIEEIFQALDTNIGGLSRIEAEKRHQQFGPNKLPEEKKKSQLFIFLKQFHSALVYVLIGAALLSYFVGSLVDVYVIMVVIIANAVIGFIYERRAERAIEALKRLIVVFAKVYREKELLKLPIQKLVPGDIILLEEGDKIPADARLIESKNFLTDESLLTGEASPQEKSPKILPVSVPLGDRKNMVWMGTNVVRGQAIAVVTAIGIQAAIGRISESIAQVKREPTHFEQKTKELTFQMGMMAVGGALIIFLIGFFLRQLNLFEIFLFSIASLVSSIPEGLPAVLTIVLAIGAHRMARRKAIVRYLPSVETLGITTVIATDKTGTITQNSMMVEKIVLTDGEEITVSGKGWEPRGLFSQKEVILHPLEHHLLRKLLHIVAVCNNGRILRSDGHFEIISEPTEAALAVLAAKAGLDKEKILTEEKKLDELPFDEDKKYRAVLVEHEKHNEIYVVGAFEKILSFSKITPKNKDKLIDKAEEMAKGAMRVLAVAYKEVAGSVKKLEPEMINHLNFVGLVGMTDPPRPEVKEAIIKARRAGVRVIMKTGDHKETAVAVAKEVGLIDPSSKNSNEVALTESDLVKMSPQEFQQAVAKVPIFARLTPAMKMKIVETLQQQGEIVAMTGDGVNDAPALKKANIGVAMGLMGTDVARGASEMILADDNFASIVNAIEEGRIVFKNVRNTSFYLVTTNVAEAVTIILSLLLGFPLPLLPIHVLWLNLITDGAISITLAAEPGHKYELNEPPKKAKEKILSKEVIPFLIINAILMAGMTLLFFYDYLAFDLEKARTMAFTLMAFFQLFNGFNMRSLKSSIFKIGFFSNRYFLIGFIIAVLLQVSVLYLPVLRAVFRFVPLSLAEWMIVILVSSSVLWVGEIYKVGKKYIKLR